MGTSGISDLIWLVSWQETGCLVRNYVIYISTRVCLTSCVLLRWKVNEQRDDRGYRSQTRRRVLEHLREHPVRFFSSSSYFLILHPHFPATFSEQELVLKLSVSSPQTETTPGQLPPLPTSISTPNTVSSSTPAQNITTSVPKSLNPISMLGVSPETPNTLIEPPVRFRVFRKI